MGTTLTLRNCALLASAVLIVAALLTTSRNDSRGDEQQTVAPKEADAGKTQPNRSPVDLVLALDDSWLVTANQTSDTASLVRVADGRVLDEVAVGRRPAAVAICPDGRRVLVSGSYGGDVTILEVAGERLRRIGAVHVGFEPHGIAVAADNNTAYVALAASAKVAVLDLKQQSVVAHIEVGRWPRYLALTADGKKLAVGCSGDRGVSVVDTATRKQLYLEMFKGLNIGHMQILSDGEYVYLPWLHYGENIPSPGNIRRGWVLGNRVARVRLDGPALREAISLDKRGDAVSDAYGLAISPDEQRLVVSASGTHELLVLQLKGLPYSKIGGTEHVDDKLYNDPQRFYRLPVGGRPMGLRIARDNRTLVVANYLENAVQVVDLDKRTIARRIDLGGPAKPSLARRGEAIFHDGGRSFDRWYSCHSCHFDGGSNAVSMDTLNDGSVYSYKTVLPLYNVFETAPWTWHGWQKDLNAAMRKSLTSTMVGPKPNDEDVEALVAYLRTLRSPPNPYRQQDGSLTAAAERGKKLFFSEQADCATCHSGPYFTDGEVHDVGLGDRGDRYKGFNTPSLLGVYRKTKLLHDGRSRDFDALLTGPHNPADITGAGELSDEQRRDLVEYLFSL